MPLVLPPDLTFAQSAIWLDQQLFRDKPIYNTGVALTIRGKLQIDLFEKALRDTVAESPCLQLPARSGTVSFDVPRIDLSQEKDPLAAAQRWMQAEMRRSIQLDGSALFRFAILPVSPVHTIWFQKYHHIIMDATGRQLLAARIAARYRSLRFGVPLPALDPATPSEVLNIERSYTTSDDHEADRRYWLERFSRLPPPFVEGNRRKTERSRSGCHGRLAFTLGRTNFAKLDTAARRLDSSVFRVIVALTYVAFARVYDRYDLVLGLELARRQDAKLRQVIGLMARPLPLLVELDPNVSIADALRQLEEMRVQDYPHRRFPIQELIRDLKVTQKGHYGLFDIIVNYVPIPYDLVFEDGRVEPQNLSYGFTTPWMVTIADVDPTSDLTVTIDFDPGLISADLATRLAACLETLLLHGMDDPHRSLGRLPIVPHTTREKLFGFATGQTALLPEGETLAALCAAQAKRTPDAIALICGEYQLSFAALHAQATGLSRRLAALGVRPGVVVGIALPRTPALIIAVLAVHKAGGAYLALDPSYPAERIRFIVSDAKAPVIITTAALADAFADSGAQLLLDTEPADLKTETADPVPARANDLAYVLYTSGSTGRPKAVGIEHRNLINLISWGRSIVSETELQGFLFSTSLNFDLSAFEMFLPLAFGGCIVMVDNLLAVQSAPHPEKIRLINSGPSLLNALLRAGGLPPNVTTIILAGERLSRHLATLIVEAIPSVRLINCYGPTETTVYSSCAFIDPTARSEPTIGRAIWNTTLHVLDAERELIPSGAEGELYIGGAGVARGYLGRSELTAERFLPNPYESGRLYRTGDRVRWRSDGELEFLGRADDQIKINGVRVEPGEIEATLLALPRIVAAAVKLHEESAGVRRLVAYLVPAPGTTQNTDDVRAILERQLPANMVPSFFVWLDAMPMTPNGKLDRKALPAPLRENVRIASDHLPETKLEREIAEIWKELLQSSPIDAHSDFFDLGGDSLALLSLFATIEARFGQRFTVDALSGGLTIAGLARLLQDGPVQLETDPVVALQPFGHLPPFFCVHGIGGDVVHLHRLATLMGTDRPFFGLRRTSETRRSGTIEELAADYAAALLVHQPVGPFYLGGHSYGAMVAYEMALQLVNQGHEIGLVAIIDQQRPGWRLKGRDAIPAAYRILTKIPGRLRYELMRVPAAERLRELRRIVQRWTRAAAGVQRDAASMFGINNGDAQLISVFDMHLRALRNYRPVPSPVPITLFRADVQLLSHLAMDSTLGWNDLAKGHVRVRRIPGNHYSITTEPLVRHLATALSRELDVAQGVTDHSKLRNIKAFAELESAAF